MSFLPKLRNTSSPEKVENIRFYGLDRNEGASEGSFIDSRNMVSRDYPFLSSRNAKFYSKLPEGMKLLGAESGNELYFVLNDGTKSYFYYGGQVKGEWEDAEQREKFFCEVGGAIYIFPDRKFYRMRNDKAIEEYKATHPRCGEVGTGYIDFYAIDLSSFAALSTNVFHTYKMAHEFDVGDAVTFWAFDKDTGEKVPLYNLPSGVVMSGKTSFKNVYVFNNNFKPYNSYEMHDTDTSYIKVEYKFTYPREYDETFRSFGNGFKANEVHKNADGDLYLLAEKELITGTAVSSDLENEFLTYSFDEGMTVYFGFQNEELMDIVPENAVIEECGVKQFYRQNNYICSAYIKLTPGSLTIPEEYWHENQGGSTTHYAIFKDSDNKDIYVTVSANYPNISDAVNVNNRLWGCEGNVIYASALGKPYIMGAYKGVATDSWAVETGIKRDFTAVYAYNSIPHYFTEDRIIKVYGSGPSSFSTSETVCAGAKEGSSASLSVCGGILYYLDKDGNIVSYTGSYPSVVSRRLNEVFTEAFTCADDRYLYCICKKEGGRKTLYVFDTLYGIWLIDGETEAEFAVSHKGCVHLFTDGFVITDDDIDISGFERYTETSFESMLEFPVTDEMLFNMKKLKKVLFKINAEEGTSLKVEVRETDSPEYRRIFERIIEGSDEVLTIPVDCKRTLGYSVRISGRGKWRLEGIMRCVSIGSYKS